MSEEQKDWKKISDAASREQDPQKLLELVNQLDQALEEVENAVKDKNRISTEEASQKSLSYSGLSIHMPPLSA